MPDLRPKKGEKAPAASTPQPTAEPRVETVAVTAEPAPEVQAVQPTPAPVAGPVVETAKITEEPARPEVVPASKAESAEPVSPMVARRQRALERQRRQAVEEPKPRTWWTSHLPVIAIGFLLALVLTIYLGRRTAHARPQQAASDPEARELDIDLGEPSESSSLDVPELAVETSVPESKPSSKSPPLLSAKPSVPNQPASKPAEGRAPASSAEDVKPVSSEVPPAAATESAAATEPVDDYPTTDPAAYRPGGRVPRTARTYPQTSTPRLR